MVSDRSDAERQLETLLRLAGIEGYEREYRFDPERRFRFDFAWPAQRVAVECDGGIWMRWGGRHGRDADREKLNLAAANGWRVLRFSLAMLKREPDRCIGMLREAMER